MVTTDARVIVPGVLGALLCGGGIAVQARINGELARELGDGYVAALISFVSGLLIVLVVLVFSRAGRRGVGVVRAELVARRIPWWLVAGGAAGALYVLSQGLAVGMLGIAVFTVAVVCGQALSGILIDSRGIGSAPPRPITAARIAGSVIMLGAVALVVSTQFLGSVPLWAILMSLAAGIAIAWQQAVNGQVRVISGSPVTATLLNMLLGSVLLVIATAVHALVVGLPQSLPSNPVLYLGGLVGVTFIALGTILAPRIGVLLLALGTIAGQLIVALLLDLVVPATGHPLTWTTVVGTALTLVALAIAALPARANSGGPRP